MNWYVLNKDGVATLCVSEQNARDEAEAYDRLYPGARPHKATALVPVELLAEARLNALRYLFLRRYGFRVGWTNAAMYSPGYVDGDAEKMEAGIDAELQAIDDELEATMNGANT